MHCTVAPGGQSHGSACPPPITPQFPFNASHYYQQRGAGLVGRKAHCRRDNCIALQGAMRRTRQCPSSSSSVLAVSSSAILFVLFFVAGVARCAADDEGRNLDDEVGERSKESSVQSRALQAGPETESKLDFIGLPSFLFFAMGDITSRVKGSDTIPA